MEFTATLIIHGCGRPGVGGWPDAAGADKGVGGQNRPIFCGRPLCMTPKYLLTKLLKN